MKTILHILLLLSATAYMATARYPGYNLDIHTGLPSNHVYNPTIDRYGYLWLCTPRGLVKYNGYEAKLINNIDIWYLYEDHKGRLWQGTISEELGYIKNDQYHPLALKDAIGPIQPSIPWEYPFGMVFKLSYNDNILIEVNDSLYKYKIKGGRHKLLLQYTDTSIIIINNNTIYELEWNKLSLKQLGTFNINFEKQVFSLFDHHVLAYNLMNGNIYTKDLYSMKEDSLQLYTDRSEHIYVVYSQQDLLNIITNKHYYILNKELQVTHKINYYQLVPSQTVNKTLISKIVYDDTWKRVITTSSSGAYISFNVFDHDSLKQELYQSIYIGSSANGEGYWWDHVNKQLITVQSGRIAYSSMPDVSDMKGARAFSSDLTFLFSYDNFFWRSEKTKQIRGFSRFSLPMYSSNIKDCYIQDTNTIYFISGANGFAKLRWQSDTAFKQTIDSGLYKEIVFDPLSKRLVVYNEKKLLIYDIEHGMKYVVNGIDKVIQKLSKIIFDQYGNVYIKNRDAVFLYNREHNSFRSLLPGIRLDNAHVAIQGNKVVISGKFGVAINTINGYSNISAPFLYSNIKGAYYDNIYGMQAGTDKILLNTDKGALTLSYPAAGTKSTYLKTLTIY